MTEFLEAITFVAGDFLETFFGIFIVVILIFCIINIIMKR